MTAKSNQPGPATLTIHLLLSAYRKAKAIITNLLRRLFPFWFSHSASPHYTERTISIQHMKIISKRSFEGTKEALENLVPPQDFSWRPLAQSGEFGAAWQQLNDKCRPPQLGSFLTPPRDLGALAEAVKAGDNKQVNTENLNATKTKPPRRSLQYQIGNPIFAGKMIRWEGGVGCYAPITVLLREEEEEERETDRVQVIFEYDRPQSTMGQFGSRELHGIAQEVDQELMRILLRASGHQEEEEEEDGTGGQQRDMRGYRAAL